MTTRKREPWEEDGLSLRERVRHYTVANGPVTTAQTCGALARHVDATAAVRAGRNRLKILSRSRTANRRPYALDSGYWTIVRIAEHGVRWIIGNNLNRLVRAGKLSRPSRGVYGPPPPKLFVPPADQKTA